MFSANQVCHVAAPEHRTWTALKDHLGAWPGPAAGRRATATWMVPSCLAGSSPCISHSLKHSQGLEKCLEHNKFCLIIIIIIFTFILFPFELSLYFFSI